MMSARIHRSLSLVTALCAAVSATGSARAQSRLVEPGQILESFAVEDATGTPYAYRNGRTPTVVVFAAAHQKRTERALVDLADLLPAGDESAPSTAILVVVAERAGATAVQELVERERLRATVLVDPEDRWRDHLGVRVTPTTIVAAADGRVAWVRAGHAFDYAADARRALRAVHGQAPPAPPARTLVPRPIPDRGAAAQRHVLVARGLVFRGRYDAAVDELVAARDLAPDRTDIRLDLAEALCRADRAAETPDVLAGLEPADEAERVRTLVVEGWTARLRGDAETARARLEAALDVDPASPRALYELGRACEALGDTAAALDAYRRALAIELG